MDDKSTKQSNEMQDEVKEATVDLKDERKGMCLRSCIRRRKENKQATAGQKQKKIRKRRAKGGSSDSEQAMEKIQQPFISNFFKQGFLETIIQEKQSIQKIFFSPIILPSRLQDLYTKRAKLKNIDLLIEGVKFVDELTEQKINKWKSAIVIYQVAYSRQSKYHFGLLIKSDSRLITLDGMKNLWPIKRAEPSSHWAVQPDDWSCGYIALFWATIISRVGVAHWINRFEANSINDQI